MIDAPRLRGAANQLRGEATQAAKRVMLQLGIVPPPLRVQLDVTDGCNFQCPMCSKAAVPPSPRELTLDQWTSALDRIRSVPLLREISISGGEPFTRPDILEILKKAKALGLRVVLLTNGWLVHRDTLRRLEEIAVDRLMVSLNSLRESVHDESRARAGSYARIMQLIDNWRAGERGMGLSLATVVMEANCGELSSIAKFAADKGLSGVIFQVLLPAEVHYPFGRDRTMREAWVLWYESNPDWVRNTNLLRSEVQAVLELQKAGDTVINPPSQLRRFPAYFENPQEVSTWPCLGTLSRLYIDPFGDMRLCYGFPPIGNVLRDDPHKIWRSAPAAEIRSKSRSCKRLCRMMNSSL